MSSDAETDSQIREGMKFDEEAAMAAGYHSPAFIYMFLGWVAAKLPQLNSMQPQQLIDLFAEFEGEMAERRKQA